MSGFLDPTHLINTFGLIGIMAILFAECGLLVGFFLPGDSLLFTAGLLVAGGLVAPLWVLLVLLPVAAVAGNLVGWWIGRTAGPAVFDRPDSRLFKAHHVARARSFFDRNGSRTIFLARFVPVVRTFATVMAGAARMDFRRFAIYSAVGGLVWTRGHRAWVLARSCRGRAQPRGAVRPRRRRAVPRAGGGRGAAEPRPEPDRVSTRSGRRT